jgi:hypothetical protein
MVAVGMRYQYAVQMLHPVAKHLLPEVRPDIHKYILARIRLNQSRCTQTPVVRVG